MATPLSIVIVEDECIAAEDIRRRLVSWGYRVPAVVATGEEAITLAEQVRFVARHDLLHVEQLQASIAACPGK